MRSSFAAVFFVCALPCATASAFAQESAVHPPPVQARAVSVEQYTAHLDQLKTLVANCSLHRDASTCDPARVGPNDEVSRPGGPRMVGYAWLRSALEAASRPETAKKEGEAKPDPAALLQAAAARLAEDATVPPATGSIAAETRHNARQQLASVLQQRQFQHLHTDDSWMDKAKQAFWQWIFKRLAGMASLSGRAQWLGEVLLWTIVLVPCALLLRWSLLQSRNRRAELPSNAPIDPASPSAREWQLWLAEAERFAAEQRWREAVHHVYWAAISRMEARGLWPADRARTPREYLRLLPSNNPLLPDLRALTGAFERIWYGHREAREREYREARALIELIDRMDRLAPK